MTNLLDPPALTQATTIAEFDVTEAALAALEHRYNGLVFDFKKKSGLAEAKKARTELRTLRLKLKEVCTEIKRPIVERGRFITAEAARITERLTNLENPLVKQIEIEEERREKEKKAYEEAERLRINTLQSRINTLRNEPVLAAASTAAQVKEKLESIRQMEIGVEFGEFQSLTQLVHAEVLDRLAEILKAKTTAEQEAERIRNEFQLLNQERQAFEKQREEFVLVATPSQLHALKINAPVAAPKGLTSVPAIQTVSATTSSLLSLVATPANETVQPVVVRDCETVKQEILSIIEHLDLAQLEEFALAGKTIQMNALITKVA